MKKYQGVLILFILFNCSFVFAKEREKQNIDQQIQKLILQLKYSQYENDREDAAMELGDLGINAKKAIPPLLKALKFDKYGAVRYESGIALSRISKNTFLAVARGAQNDSDESVREILTKHLPKYGKVAIPVLIETLIKEKNCEVKTEAVRALGTFKEKAISGMPYFIKLLDTKNEFLRFRLFTAIKNVGVKGLPFLIQGLKSKKNDLIRIRSAWLIGKMGSKASSAIPDLIQALKDKNDYVKMYSAYAFGKIGSQAISAVPHLIQLLGNKNDNVKIYAIRGLEGIGKKAFPAIPKLILLLQNQNKEVQSFSAYTLGEIGEKSTSAIPTLIKLLKDKNENVRHSSTQALGKIKSKPHIVIPSLILSIKDEVGYVRIAAIKSIGNFGKKATFILPELLEMMKITQDKDVKKAIIKAIQEIRS